MGKAAKAINSHSKTLLETDKIYPNSKDPNSLQRRFVITILRSENLLLFSTFFFTFREKVNK